MTRSRGPEPLGSGTAVDVPAAPEDHHRPDGCRRAVLVLAGVAAVVALLAAVGPLSDLYVIRVQSGDSGYSFLVTGWHQRSQSFGADAVEAGPVGYGPVFLAGALLVALGAALSGRPQRRAVGLGLVVAGAAATTAMTCLVQLDYRHVTAGYTDVVDGLFVTSSLGTGGVLTLLAGLLGLLVIGAAIGLLALPARPTGPPPSRPAPHGGDPPAEPDDAAAPQEPPAASRPPLAGPAPDPSPWDEDPDWRHRSPAAYRRAPGTKPRAQAQTAPRPGGRLTADGPAPATAEPEEPGEQRP